MLANGPDLLTTGQAAKLCSVTPDTVLKWIKKGRITARRTAGGHYRIERRVIEPLIVSPQPAECETLALAEHDPEGLHCWEYLSDRGAVRDQCRQCVVYRVRAARCFMMAGLNVEVGHAREFCQGTCDECLYYRWVKGLLTNVLVITPDEGLIERLVSEETNNVTFRCARNAYEASTIVQNFQAAFVVVDDEILADAQRGLLDSLAHDPRLPGVRIILGVSAGTSGKRAGELQANGVWSVIEKPFGLRQISAAIAETEALLRRGHHARSRV
ncbi:MAG: excisionase family DNA-binding protein [Planctomycetota bacterium]|jgi:excisionase family DNA binding protein